MRARLEIPDEKIVVGIPAKEIGDVQKKHKEELSRFKAIYRDLARRYPVGLKKIE